ncbi:VaFE repeat-containing surface-anchored protein [Corynebacterium mastitidis]
MTEERPTPRKPVIETKAELADETAFVKAGATVNDTVTYTDLVPGKQYTLDAQLVDKADASRVLGSGSKSFTADASGSGKVVVPIRVNDDVRSPVASAVAFETLKSSDKEAQDNRAERLTDGSKPSGDVIADHKDINDEAQTVTSEELKSAKIELKKYIGDQEFTGSEKPQSGGAGSAGVVDAQDVDTAYEAKKDQDLTVTFAVTNAGDLDLKDVKVSDQLITGEGFASSDLSAISPAKQNIAKGETKYFTATLKAPAAGKIHGDKAKAGGTPVDGDGNETPYTDDKGKEREPGTPVESNEDPAHAKTPEQGEPKLELKKYINDNDAQTAEEAEELKPGEKATVKFVVTNSGEVDLFNVTLSDETVEGVGDVANIQPKQIDRLKVDESGEFTGELTLPEGGQDHKDVAHAEGVPPSPENPDEPGDVPPVPSNDDPAHARTPKPDEPKLELKKYINGNDAQTAEDAVMASKAGEELEVTFVVTNAGAVDVFNVTVEDSLLDSDESGVKVDDPKPASAEDEAKAQRLAPGEKVTFKGTIPAPEPGKLHADQAKAKGVAPKPCNPDEPGDTPVKSNEPTEEPSKPAKPSEKEPTPSEPVKPGEPGKPNEPKPGKPSDSAPEPKITTDAMIEDQGALVAGATVVDTVSFENLVPGKKYELSAELMCKASGESTGATAKVTFLARVADGQINVPVSVTDGDCSEQVVFETLRNADGEVVAVHHDINDEAQTVTAQDVLKPAPSQETQESKRDHNVTRVTEEAPEVGKPVAPKTPRRSIKAVPSGSLVFEEGMPSRI